MNSQTSNWHGFRLVYGLALLSLVAGCATAGRKLADNDSDFKTYRTHEARRMTLADAKVPKAIASTQEDRQPGELPTIQTVLFEEDKKEPLSPLLPAPVESDFSNDAEIIPPPEGITESESFPIDLPTALQLAGANNLQIAFAAERVQQAIAQADRADVLWVPSLRAGMVYNYHTGQIQDTAGTVIHVDRSSLFLGGGAGTGNSPLNGPSGGPRMFVDLSPIDVLFEPLAARQAVQASQANQTAAFNDTLLETATAYLALLRAHALVAIAEEAVKNAEELARLTENFARTGRGLQADADRARAELQSRQRMLLAAKEQAAVASAELARILRLDPATTLLPAEPVPVPIHLIEGETDIHSLIAQAQTARPELASAGAGVQETWYRIRQERLRPWVPTLYAGVSGGGFGGSPGGAIDDFGGRTDFDLAAIWEVQNMGLGNGARRREQESLHRQAHITMDRLRDIVATEVTQAHQRVHFREKQIGTTRSQILSATESLSLNMEGIRGGVIRPIELQQAIGAVASARQQHLDAVLDFNLAQFELLRAIGRPPEPMTTP